MILIIIIIVGLIGFYAIKQTIENKLLNDKLRVQQRIYENYIYSLNDSFLKESSLTEYYLYILNLGKIKI